MQHTKDTATAPRWPIPTARIRGNCRRLAFDQASEEVQAKFRELYPVTPNREMAEWFGIGIVTVGKLGHRLGLGKNLSAINRSEEKRKIGTVIRHIRETDPDRFADMQRRKAQTMRKLWRKARIQAEYGLPRTVSLRVSPLNDKQRVYKAQMTYRLRYFSDPNHPFWVCYDSQTTRSPRMEAKAIDMGLKIVEGED